MPLRAKANSPHAARVAAVRRFNRFYTRVVGVIDEGGYLHSPFTLAEGRVLFELAQREAPTASALVSELGLDAGYVSRLLQRSVTVGEPGIETEEYSKDTDVSGRRSRQSLRRRPHCRPGPRSISGTS